MKKLCVQSGLGLLLLGKQDHQVCLALVSVRFPSERVHKDDEDEPSVLSDSVGNNGVTSAEQ